MIDEQGSERQKKRKHIIENKKSKQGNSSTTGMTPTITIKAPTAAAEESTEANTFSVNRLKIDAQTARNAIIMSEIIGPPKAKRRRL